MIRSILPLLIATTLFTIGLRQPMADETPSQQPSFTDMLNSEELQPLVPPPPNPKFYQNADFHSGVPLGGIGCGSVEIMPNGLFGNATINNNWTDPIPIVPGWFACIWSNTGGRIHAMELTHKSTNAMPGVENVFYHGDFPRATLRYEDRHLPLQITMQAYSPIIPFDLMNSSLPAFYMIYNIRNDSGGTADVTLALSLEGLNGLSGTHPISSQNTVFNESPLKNGTVGFNINSSAPAASQQSVSSNRMGDYALLTQTPSPDMQVNIREWDDSGGTPSWWDYFSRTGALPGKAETDLAAKHPAGVIAIHFSMKNGETFHIPFAVAWYTPRLQSDSGKEYGHLYDLNFEDADSLARYLLENRYVFDALTDEWRDRLRQSSLPNWFIDKLMNNASVLFTNTILTQDSGGSASSPGPSVFDYYDVLGENADSISTLNKRVCVQPLLLALFPTLDRTQLLQFLSMPTSNGSLPLHDGYSFINANANSEPPSDTFHPIDATLSGILQITRYYMWTHDDAFLQIAYPHVKRAVDLIALNAANNGNIPSGATMYGSPQRIASSSYLATLWMAALKSSQSLAEIRKDETFASLCGSLLKAAQKAVTEKLWNGKNLDGPLAENGDETTHPESNGELAGQALLQPFDEDKLLPENILRFAISTMIAENSVDNVDSYTGLAELFQGSLYAYNSNSNACLSLLQRLYHWEINELKSPWAVPATMTEDHSADGSGKDAPPCSMDTAASWSCLYALEGFSLDLPEEKMGFLPNLPDGWTSLSAPIFAPSFWGWMTYIPEKGNIHITFRLDRLIPIGTRAFSHENGVNASSSNGAGFECRELLLPRLKGGTDTVTAILQDSQAPGSVIQKTEQTLLYRFDQPVEIGVGRKLEVVVK